MKQFKKLRKKYQHPASVNYLALLIFSLTLSFGFAQKTKMPVYVSEATDIKFVDTSKNLVNGTAKADGEKSIILYGDPKKANLYTILVYIPANTRINPVTHPDDGFVTVLSGKWYVGFGDVWDDSKLKPLTQGGIYTEPSNTLHFGETRDEPTILSLTRFGPSGTIYGPKK